MNNNPLTPLQEQVLGILRERFLGNEITGAELSRLLNVQDKDGKAGANMRSVVNSLRDKGRVVCANSKGYYYPRSVEELTEYTAQFQNRIDEQQAACNILKQRVVQWHEINAAKIAERQPDYQPKLI